MIPLSLGVFLAIISLGGFCLNGYILLVLILTKQVSPNNILLIHLSATQSLLSLIFLVFSFPPIVHPGSWIASIEFTCIINGLLFTILHPLTLWTICGLNCDRYYAIAAPLHYSAIVTNKKVICGLISGWIAIIFLSIPPFFKVAPIIFSTNMSVCLPNFATPTSLWYAIVFTSITLIIPGIVMIGCNIKVLMIARYHRHRIAAAIYEVTLSAQVTITHQRNPFFVPTVTAPGAGGPKFRSRSPIAMVLQLVGSFVILYLPYYLTIIWDSVSVLIFGDISDVPNIYKTNEYFVIVAATLLAISTIINAILYGLKSKTIRKSFQNYWRKQRTKNEIHQEIQARTPSTCGSRRPSMTNLGFLTRPLLQRRLSETLIDIDRRVNGTQRPKMKRIASELTWRPISLTFAGLESPPLPSNRPKTTLAHTSSCNTLQVPNVDNEIMITKADQELYNSVRNSFRAASKAANGGLNSNPRKSMNLMVTNGCHHLTSGSPDQICYQKNSNQSKVAATHGPTNFLLHKVFRLDSNEQSKRLIINNSNISNQNQCSCNTNTHCNQKKVNRCQHGTAVANIRQFSTSPLKSPRILITRALSDESDSKTPSLPATPAKERVQRQYSSSANLSEMSSIQAKWYLHDKMITIEIDSSENDSKQAEGGGGDGGDGGGSTSTTVSENNFFGHRRYSSLEENSCCSKEFEMDSGTEEQLLLSWPTTKRRQKMTCSNIGIRNAIFGPSPLFNDRCEEPEVIL